VDGQPQSPARRSDQRDHRQPDQPQHLVRYRRPAPRPGRRCRVDVRAAKEPGFCDRCPDDQWCGLSGNRQPERQPVQPEQRRQPGQALATGAYTDGNTTTLAAYVFDTLKINDQFQLNGGARFERFRTSTNSAALVGTAPTYQLTPASLSVSDNLFSWKLGALYKPAANGSIYAAYANSKTPPGSSTFVLSATASSGDNAVFSPQETTNLEIGTKWELLNKRLNLSAAAYRTENDKQVSYNALDNSYSQFGKTRVEGIELAAVGQLTNFWQISAGWRA